MHLHYILLIRVVDELRYVKGLKLGVSSSSTILPNEPGPNENRVLLKSMRISVGSLMLLVRGCRVRLEKRG